MESQEDYNRRIGIAVDALRAKAINVDDLVQQVRERAQQEVRSAKAPCEMSMIVPTAVATRLDEALPPTLFVYTVNATHDATRRNVKFWLRKQV